MDILHSCSKSGTTVQSIEFPSLLTFRIPIAPTEEQHRIVAEIEKQFTRLDAGVAALERARANLKRYRAAVLKAACEGRLVPTEAELAHAEERDFETADRLLARILQERRSRWDEVQRARFAFSGKTLALNGRAKYREPEPANVAELPEPPAGWCWTTLDSLMSTIVDGTHHTPRYIKEGVPFLSVKDIRNERIFFDDCKYISQAEHEELSKRCRPEYGDILVTKSGTIGRLAVVRTMREFSLFVSVAVLKPAASEVLTNW